METYNLFIQSKFTTTFCDKDDLKKCNEERIARFGFFKPIISYKTVNKQLSCIFALVEGNFHFMLD